MRIMMPLLTAAFLSFVVGCGREAPPAAPESPAVPERLAVDSFQAALRTAAKAERRNPGDVLPDTFEPRKINTYDFVLDEDITDLGKQGDRIWQVFMPSVVRDGQKRCAWVNAKTAQVKFLAKHETYGGSEQSSRHVPK